MNIFFTSNEWAKIFLLSLPLIIAGTLHMIVVKKDILSYFKKPIHQSLFGLNKTWRGFIVMPIATLPGVYLAHEIGKYFELDFSMLANNSLLLSGFYLGTAYCLAELPNSFIKRRLGIQEGKTSPRAKWFFILLDQADSALGCALAYLIFFNIQFRLLLGTVFFGTIIHLLINRFLYELKLRKNPY